MVTIHIVAEVIGMILTGRAILLKFVNIVDVKNAKEKIKGSEAHTKL